MEASFGVVFTVWKSCGRGGLWGAGHGIRGLGWDGWDEGGKGSGKEVGGGRHGDRPAKL